MKSKGENDPLTLLKTKLIFEELDNERMGEIQNLSKQIAFHNLIYYFKDEKNPKNFINLNGSLAFYKNNKGGCGTIEKAEEK